MDGPQAHRSRVRMPRTPPRRIAIAWPLAIGLLAVTVHAGACSSPIASTPATSPVKGNLILSGNTILAGIGQTTQLSVTNSAGAPVTSGVQWQTSSLGTATVSPTGLVTAANPGT